MLSIEKLTELLKENIVENEVKEFKINFEKIKTLINVNDSLIIVDLFNSTLINDKIDIFKYLLEKTDYKTNHDDNDFIKIVTANGYLELFKFLLTFDNINVQAAANHALRWAAINGFIDIVNIILNNYDISVLDKRIIEALKCCEDIEGMEDEEKQQTDVYKDIILSLWRCVNIKEYVKFNDYDLYQSINSKLIANNVAEF
jgi:hypothetical protein